MKTEIYPKWYLFAVALFALSLLLVRTVTTKNGKRAPYGIRLFAANSDCSITVNGTSYSVPFPGLAFGPVGTVGDSVNLNVRWAWTTHDPANALTVTTLIVEWLR